MDDTLKDILQTLAANGHPLDVTVVTGTQYRDCTFIQHTPPASSAARAAEPSAGTTAQQPAAEGDPAAGTAAPPTPAATATAATPTRDEQVAAAIQEVMEQKDEQGVYIFQYVRQWQSIYRILADRGIVRPRDYKGFTDYIATICPTSLRIAPTAKTLSKTDLGLLAKPFDDWTPSRFPGNRTTYQRYALVAQAFATRLATLDT